LLVEVRESLPHGEWLPWLQANVPFTDRTARNYIRLHDQRDRLKLETVSDMTGAYRLLSAGSDTPESKEQEPDYKALDAAYRRDMMLFRALEQRLKSPDITIEEAKVGFDFARERQKYWEGIALDSERELGKCLTAMPADLWEVFCKDPLALGVACEKRLAELELTEA
jgi:hypothetical protein